ncbi:MAG: hypothetical protein KA715_07030 [Xanthomonadaceae bacterium]|nr:hypothetical protein [Xanthomonadaceae bacterium]
MILLILVLTSTAQAQELKYSDFCKTRPSFCRQFKGLKETFIGGVIDSSEYFYMLCTDDRGELWNSLNDEELKTVFLKLYESINPEGLSKEVVLSQAWEVGKILGNLVGGEYSKKEYEVPLRKREMDKWLTEFSKEEWMIFIHDSIRPSYWNTLADSTHLIKDHVRAIKRFYDAIGEKKFVAFLKTSPIDKALEETEEKALEDWGHHYINYLSDHGGTCGSKITPSTL